MEDDFSFLADRVTEGNPETDYFLVDSDPTFIEHFEEDDLERDKVLLRFKQHVWVLNKDSEKFIEPYYSYYFKQKDSEKFHIHHILYNELLADKIKLQKSLELTPTLSFRTLILTNQTHIKFGLPIHYGRFLRDNHKKESLTAMYLSDYCQALPKIEKLSFFKVYKGYSFIGVEKYSVQYRTTDQASNMEPVGCYFNRILNHSNLSAQESFNRALMFVENINEDFEAIFIDLSKYGLGLEIHGQNLLVITDEKNKAKRDYVYRDFGNCTLEKHIYEKQTVLNDYYAQYKHILESKYLRSAKYRQWMSFRIFFLGFLVYNLNNFAKKENLNFDVYSWYKNVLKKLPELNNLY